MKIIADSNQPFAAEAFGLLGEVVLLPAKAITREVLRGADALVCRSTIKVNEELLRGTPVKFVGTCTIGVDHVDEKYLSTAGIAFAAAPGCNARSVSEYFTAAVLRYCVQNGLNLAGKTVGVIGVGNVGRLVAEKVRALGMRVLLNDPPREEAEGSAGFTPLPELLAASDIVTLHVPLEKGGEHPTFGMADAEFFARLRPGALFINAARGKVVVEDALLAALESGRLGGAVLDVFPQEPQISPRLHERLFIATPHIAGHSHDGKVVGTQMIFDAANRFFAANRAWDYRGFMPKPQNPELVALETGSLEERLETLVRASYDIMADDAVLRRAPQDFHDYRQNYPLRLEFAHYRVRAEGDELAQTAQALGFQT